MSPGTGSTTATRRSAPTLHWGTRRNAAADPLFGIYSLGVATGRDSWAYNFSRPELLSSMSRTVDFYNVQSDKFSDWADRGGGSSGDVEQFIDRDPAKISWTTNVKGDLRKGKPAIFDPKHVVPSMYRPFCKQWLYFDRQWNERMYQIPKLFPTPEQGNLVIAVSAASDHDHSSRRSSLTQSRVLPGRRVQRQPVLPALPLRRRRARRLAVCLRRGRRRLPTSERHHRRRPSTGTSPTTVRTSPRRNFLLRLRPPPLPGVPDSLRRRPQENDPPHPDGRRLRRLHRRGAVGLPQSTSATRQPTRGRSTACPKAPQIPLISASPR